MIYAGTAYLPRLIVLSCVPAKSFTEKSNSKAWIGYLVVAIAILILLFIYLKYKKTKPAPNPMSSLGKATGKSINLPDMDVAKKSPKF
jgi:hypothetical protein